MGKAKLENKTTIIHRSTLSINAPYKEGMSKEDCVIAHEEASREALIGLFEAMAGAIQRDATAFVSLFPFEFTLSIDQCGWDYRFVAEWFIYPRSKHDRTNQRRRVV